MVRKYRHPARFLRSARPAICTMPASKHILSPPWCAVMALEPHPRCTRPERRVVLAPCVPPRSVLRTAPPRTLRDPIDTERRSRPNLTTLYPSRRCGGNGSAGCGVDCRPRPVRHASCSSPGDSWHAPCVAGGHPGDASPNRNAPARLSSAHRARPASHVGW